MDNQQKMNVFSQLQESFQPARAAGIKANIQLNLTGEGGGKYYAHIENQELTGGEGVVENPRITITADSKDLLNIFEGRMDPMKAYFQGRIQVKGDIGFAMQLIGIVQAGKKVIAGKSSGQIHTNLPVFFALNCWSSF